MRSVLLGFKTRCSDGMQFLNGALLYGDGVVNDVADYVSTDSLPVAESVIASPVSPSTLNWLDTFSMDLRDLDAGFYASRPTT